MRLFRSADWLKLVLLLSVPNHPLQPVSLKKLRKVQEWIGRAEKAVGQSKTYQQKRKKRRRIQCHKL
jgi:hypothetical protein